MWGFLDTGHHPGSFNMAFDEALVAQFASSPAAGRRAEEGILRVYGWMPHAISLGAHQSAGDFDLDLLARSGIDIVRRPTGGRAILHAHELTYSVVLDAGDRGGVRAVYRTISGGLLEGLRLLGIAAELAGGDDEHFATPWADPASIPCFSSSARCEIRFEGKKLVGSAQRRYGTVVLQHGSLLLGSAHRRITEFLAPEVRAAAHAVLEDHLRQRTTEAETILARPVTFEEAARCLRLGFERALDITFTESSLAARIPA